MDTGLLSKDIAGSESHTYRLMECVGKGGFGVVFRGMARTPAGLSKLVAVKILTEDASRKPDFARRLRDEARVLALLSHRAITRVDDCFTIDGRWAIIEEFIEGVDMRHVLAVTAIPPRSLCEIVAEVASALHAVHTAKDPQSQAPLQLIHRDIKPSNIRLTPEGGIKVMDFGIARGVFGDREAKTRNMAYGSQGYIAPERVDGVDEPVADVYALGVVAWEGLAGEEMGQLPVIFKRYGPTLDAKLALLEERLEKRFSRAVLPLLRSMMAYDFADRPTADTVADRFQDMLIEADGPWLKRWIPGVLPEVLAEARRQAEAEARPRFEPDSSDTLRPMSIGVEDLFPISGGLRPLDKLLHDMGAPSIEGDVPEPGDMEPPPSKPEEVGAVGVADARFVDAPSVRDLAFDRGSRTEQVVQIGMDLGDEDASAFSGDGVTGLLEMVESTPGEPSEASIEPPEDDVTKVSGTELPVAVLPGSAPYKEWLDTSTIARPTRAARPPWLVLLTGAAILVGVASIALVWSYQNRTDSPTAPMEGVGAEAVSSTSPSAALMDAPPGVEAEVDPKTPSSSGSVPTPGPLAAAVIAPPPKVSTTTRTRYPTRSAARTAPPATQTTGSTAAATEVSATSVPTGTVVVKGAAVKSITLKSKDGRVHEAGDVPVGWYTVAVTWPSGRVVHPKPREVKAGEVTTILCDASVEDCR